MNVAEAREWFCQPGNKVYSEGINIDLERDNKVMARLTPAKRHSPLAVGELNAFLAACHRWVTTQTSLLRTSKTFAPRIPPRIDIPENSSWLNSHPL